MPLHVYMHAHGYTYVTCRSPFGKLRRTSSRGSLSDTLGNANKFLQASLKGKAILQDGADSRKNLFDGVEDAAAQYPVVTRDMARPGLMVTLNLKQFAGPGRARFRGDTGPGVMMEDHFGDGELWRVRWIQTVRCM